MGIMVILGVMGKIAVNYRDHKMSIIRVVGIGIMGMFSKH